MKLSTRARYGMRAILEIAKHYNKGPVSIKEIARNQEISEKYLEHLLVFLRSAELIKSTRGAKGGYVLVRPPEEIRLSQIVRVLEGSLSPVDCVDTPTICNRSGFCPTRDVWSLIKHSIAQVLYSITLQGLIEREEKKLKDKPLVYNI